jgi:hypothetical protein
MHNTFVHPILLLFLKKWLKNSILNLNKNIFINKIIFPILINFVFNGLKQIIIRYKIWLIKKKRILINFNNVNKNWTTFYLKYIRYINNFVILMQLNYYKKKNQVFFLIIKFLKLRGLILNNTKTKIFKLSNNIQFDFLGYIFKYNYNWKIKYNTFKIYWNTKFKNIIVYPNKNKVYSFINKIKFIFKKSLNLDIYNLILIINSMLKNWSKYYNMYNSYYYKNIIKNILFHLTWNWVKKKHKCWGRTLIVNTYFLRKIKCYKNFLRKKYFLKFKNIKWVFYSIIKNQLIYNKSKIFYLLYNKNNFQLLTNIHFIISKNLLNIHIYHINYIKLVMFDNNFKFKLIKLNSIIKQRLF